MVTLGEIAVLIHAEPKVSHLKGRAERQPQVT